MRMLCRSALEELSQVVEKLEESSFEEAVETIRSAQKIALYGVGREGLQIKGFAMRLFHLGLRVSMVGDMTTPPLGSGDLLIVSAGPGYFSTVAALIETAKQAGAKTLCITAQPDGACAVAADQVLVIPAQTMADDMASKTSTLPMGSLYEGAQYVVFECLILKLKQVLAVSADDMRHNHTNLE
ncbi:SIS domain-containing protein [uncultured Cohaesibacter sp.]|uniref:SIS domain-containing protein n=1 Tax=uncultured Cohaesibacter sp. TaxID=1002546 RepID=UPI0029C770FE|nr:SIS domain-containing protein [uncultured Cohaesibacter sp.]